MDLATKLVQSSDKALLSIQYPEYAISTGERDVGRVI